MSKKYVLAIDQSTQFTKSFLFDEDGKAVFNNEIPHKQDIDHRGWVSHDLNEIYKNVIDGIALLKKETKINDKQISCVGICNQRETSAVWDRLTGEPLSKAIVWQCSRAEDICNSIRKDGVEEKIFATTGMYLSPYYPASKFAWFLQNVSGLKEKMRKGTLCFGTIDSWLLFKLTQGKVFATDYSNASRTQLLNIKNLSWDKDICKVFGIDPTALPKIVDSGCMVGKTDFEGIFDSPLPICSIMGDSQAALFGQGGVIAGMVKATYGTGSSVMMNIGDKSNNSGQGLVTSIGWKIEDELTYVLEGNINYAGAVITWLKDDVGIISDPSETQAMAEKANVKDHTFLVPAFTGLGAPYWKPNATATIVGMSRITGKNEIVKAGLESIAYQISDVIKMMEKESSHQPKELLADGGPTKNEYLMRFQSDILNTKVTLSTCQDCSAQGVAYMAGITSGLYKKDILNQSDNRKHYESHMADDERDRRYNGWKIAVSKAL